MGFKKKAGTVNKNVSMRRQMQASNGHIHSNTDWKRGGICFCWLKFCRVESYADADLLYAKLRDYNEDQWCYRAPNAIFRALNWLAAERIITACTQI